VTPGKMHVFRSGKFDSCMQEDYRRAKLAQRVVSPHRELVA
jgi:hypothetical protein